MRRLRWLAALTIATAPLALGSPALADGGAYFQLDRTYYPAGAVAKVETYVFVPANQQDVFDRGPFYAYLLPNGAWLTEGRPLPREAVRIGMFAVEPTGRRTFELSGSFAVPSLPTGTYGLQLCNDPCTIAGFREPLTGLLTVAATQTEADLLRTTSKLEWRAASLRRQVAKLQRTRDELEGTLGAAVVDRDAARADLAVLRSSLATAPPSSTPSADANRPLVDAWGLVAVAGGLLVTLASVALAIVFSRRHVPAARGVMVASGAPRIAR
jgi:hypothetical protein